MPNGAPDQRPETAGVLLLLVAVIGWGANWPPLKLLVAEVPVLTMRAWSGLAGALLLALLVGGLARVPLAVPRGVWPGLCLAAALNITAWMGLAAFSLHWLGAAEACLLCYTMPVWAALLAWPVLGERPTRRRMLALGLGLAGLVVIVAGQGVAIGIAKLPGVALALASALLFALGTVLTKRRPLAMPPAAGVVWQVLLGMLPLAALAVLLGQAVPDRLSPLGWGLMAWQAVVPLCLCYLAWFAALRRLPATVATTGTLLAPVVGVASSALLLGEPFGLPEASAMALVLGGVALAARG